MTPSLDLEHPYLLESGFSEHCFREAAAIIPVLEHLPCHLIQLSETDVLYPVALVHRTRTWELIGFTELTFVNILQEMSYKIQTITGLEALSPTNAAEEAGYVFGGVLIRTQGAKGVQARLI